MFDVKVVVNVALSAVFIFFLWDDRRAPVFNINLIYKKSLKIQCD
jgi:hypothetical protein